jgi:polyphosphate glucokinase
MEILGIDIGGSGIKGAPVDISTGKLVSDRIRFPTPNPSSPENVASKLIDIVKHFGWKGPVGCGFPAVVNAGKIYTASNIDKNWIGTNASQLFSKTTDCDFVIINDADAAGVAEMAFGAGKDNQGVVFIITVGTGIGSALFSKGRLVPNTELGHLIMHGIIAERYCSDAVRKNEDLSWKKWSKRLNEYLVEIERLFWPDLIIIGGGVSKKHSKFFHYLETKTEVVAAHLRNEAGMIGAAMATKYL